MTVATGLERGGAEMAGKLDGTVAIVTGASSDAG